MGQQKLFTLPAQPFRILAIMATLLLRQRRQRAQLVFPGRLIRQQ